MKLRNLYKENPSYKMDVMEILYGKGSIVGNSILNNIRLNSLDAKQYDLVVECKAQDLFVGRIKVVIDRTTADDVLSFAQIEIQNINSLFENVLDKKEHDICCAKLGLSKDIDLKSKTWEVDVISRYKEYLETFMADGYNLEIDASAPDDKEILFREIFSALENLSHNIVIEYRHYTRDNANDKWGDYEIVSVAGCTDAKMFQKSIIGYIDNGISNLKTKLKKGKLSDKKQFIAEIKQRVVRYKAVLEDELFTNAKFKGNRGWHIAFEKNRQDSIQYKITDFIKAWETSISELIPKLLIVEHGMSGEEYKPTSISSFQYESDSFDDDIDIMLDALKKNKLIDDLTTKPKLRNVFAGKQITDKVIWIGGINTLSYFIKKLVDNGKIDSSADYWKIAQICFTNTGKSFKTEQLKQAKIPAKKKAEIIDRIMNNL